MTIQSEKIGFIGLGAMGKGMAANCVKKGFDLIVSDIRPEPVAELTALGAATAWATFGQKVSDMFLNTSNTINDAL